MKDDALKPLTAPTTATILEVLEVIEHNGYGFCCLVDEDRHLVGLTTDGDVRRAIIAGVALDANALSYATAAPYTVPLGTPRANVLDLMRALRVNAVPEVDPDGRLASVHTLADIIGAPRIPNTAVIMAGGKGTRLGDLTRSTPKPLMLVAGRPIIEWVVLGLVSDGITSIYVSVNYLADQIVDRLGNGEHLGCRIEYLRERSDHPLGTAGSLTLLPAKLTEPGAPALFVLNGDLIVDFDARELLASHTSNNAALTIATKGYEHEVPFGVIGRDPDGSVIEIIEKPTFNAEINAAIYCLDAPVARLLPNNQPSTMPELAQTCIAQGKKVRTWPLRAEWTDVGNPRDLARAQGRL